jgi:hypothetical protein
VDLGSGLRGRLHPPVDLGVELAEPPIHRLDERLQAAVDLGVALAQLAATIGAQRDELGAEQPGEPKRDGDDAEREQCDESHVDHGRRTIGRGSDGAAGRPPRLI